MAISNHSSFRLLLDKIASVYFISKIHLYFETASPGYQHCANCIGTLSFPTGTQMLTCYLPPGRGDNNPALTQAEAGTRLSDPEGMQG